jgi:hypothetical protein
MFKQNPLNQKVTRAKTIEVLLCDGKNKTIWPMMCIVKTPTGKTPTPTVKRPTIK